MCACPRGEYVHWGSTWPSQRLMPTVLEELSDCDNSTLKLVQGDYCTEGPLVSNIVSISVGIHYSVCSACLKPTFLQAAPEDKQEFLHCHSHWTCPSLKRPPYLALPHCMSHFCSLCFRKQTLCLNIHIPGSDISNSGLTSQLKSKQALQSSCISDLLYKLSTQALTSTGLAPQIQCKRVFTKRSLVLLLNKRFVKWHTTCPGHTETPADYRTVFRHLLFLLLNGHGQVCTGMFMPVFVVLFHLHTQKMFLQLKQPLFSVHHLPALYR